MKKRNVAYKVWLSQLANSKYIKQTGEFESGYIDLEGKKISRVNIIATVVSKFISDDGNYTALTIDDGSNEVRLKAWGEDCRLIKNIEPSSLVLAVGKIKEYNNELYILPEIVKHLADMNWEIARKMDLLKEYGFVRASEKPLEIMNPEKPEYAEEKVESNVSNEARNTILGIINKINGSDGASINEIARLSGLSQEETNAIIDELVRDGEIYKSRVGVVNLV